MILYHGSNLEIELVDFNESKPGKDFDLYGWKQAVYEGLLLNGGDSATSYRRRRNGASRTGPKGEKEGRRR